MCPRGWGTRVRGDKHPLPAPEELLVLQLLSWLVGGGGGEAIYRHSFIFAQAPGPLGLGPWCPRQPGLPKALVLSKKGISPTATSDKSLGREQGGSLKASESGREAGWESALQWELGEGTARTPNLGASMRGDGGSQGAGPTQVYSIPWIPSPQITCPFIPPPLAPSKGTHGVVLGCPLPAKMTFHILRGEEVTETDRRGAGGSRGSMLGAGSVLGPTPAPI